MAKGYGFVDVFLSAQYDCVLGLFHLTKMYFTGPNLIPNLIFVNIKEDTVGHHSIW